MTVASKYIREVNVREEEPFEVMNNVAEIKGFTWPGISFDWRRDVVNHHGKEVQEMISQKIMEAQTHN